MPKVSPYNSHHPLSGRLIIQNLIKFSLSKHITAIKGPSFHQISYIPASPRPQTLVPLPYWLSQAYPPMPRPSARRDTLLSADAFLLAESSWLTGSMVSSSRFSSQNCTEMMPSSYWLTGSLQMVSPSRFFTQNCTRTSRIQYLPSKGKREQTAGIPSCFHHTETNSYRFLSFSDLHLIQGLLKDRVLQQNTRLQTQRPPPYEYLTLFLFHIHFTAIKGPSFHQIMIFQHPPRLHTVVSCPPGLSEANSPKAKAI